ncbi:signal peptidase I [Actinomycetospora sp. OC33-EN08]|uniref:Signal peptidase I n=1 Tax=Actinomycetospora aurantiaca TaxID=3129233 RepID=A0ABU8MMK2_9PSEU
MPPTDEPGRRYRAPRHGGVDPRWGGPSEADPGDDPYGEPTGERVRAGGRHGAADERTDRPDDARRAPAWGRHGHDAPDAADGRRPASEWPPPTALPSGPPRDGRHPGPTPTFGRGPGQAPPSPPHGQSRPHPPSPPYGQRPPSPPYGQPPANGQVANGYGAPRPAGPPANGHTPSGRFGAVPEQHPGRPTPTATQPPVAEEPSARADVPLLAGGTPPPGRTGESPTTADPDAESAVTETTGLGPNTGKHRRGGAGATSGPGRDEDADDRSGPGRRRDKDTGKASGKKKRKGSFWRELPLLVVVAIVLTFVIQTFIARIYVIPSASMEQTLHGCTGCANDRVAVDKVSYRFTDPAPGDVVVFRGPPAWLDNDEVGQTEPSGNPLVRGFQEALSLVGLAAPNEKDFVKRVIAVGGQTVACCDPQNRVLVDGRPLDEPYLYYQDGLGAQQATFDPVQVPQGQLWVMGDNRNNSADARFHGPVPTSDIIGKARVVVLPITRWRTVPAIDPQATTTALGSPTGLPEGGAAVAGALLAVPLARSARRLRRAAPAVTSAAPPRPGPDPGGARDGATPQ